MAKDNKLIKAANFKDFDWNKAKLFYHIAKCGSFIKAGRLAGTDQATLTRQIQALEKQIGYPLLIRKPGGISLTSKGEELLENVAPFFLKMRGFCGSKQVEVAGKQKRKIRIVTTHALAAYVLTDLFLDYSKKNHNVAFEIICDDFMMDIILNDADIAIQPFDSRFTETKVEGVEAEYLFTVQKRLYASEEYINLYGEPKSVDDLINHHIIAFPQSEIYSFYKNINWILSLGMQKGRLHVPIYTSNSVDSQIEAAKEGIGIVGSYDIFKIIKNSNLKIILPDVKDKPFRNYFLYPSYHKDDKTILDIKYFLTDRLNSNSNIKIL